MNADLLWHMYRTMLRIRLTEECLARLTDEGEINTPCHLCIGQEAVAAGVCAALSDGDYVWGGHRSHGHYLARGGDLTSLIAETMGKVTGCSRGRGGSMHLFAADVGILGTVPIVAATIPLAVGAALASCIRRTTRVSAAFFGDGAAEEGVFHEALNLAALYRLPVVFVCENNFYASHLSLLERRPADNIYQLGEHHGVPGVRLDGNDAAQVYGHTKAAITRARAGGGPTLLECRTYRWRGHVGPSRDEDVGLGRRDGLKEWQLADPIRRARKTLAALDISDEEFAAAERAILDEIDRALTAARRAPSPSEGDLLRHVFA